MKISSSPDGAWAGDAEIAVELGSGALRAAREIAGLAGRIERPGAVGKEIVHERHAGRPGRPPVAQAFGQCHEDRRRVEHRRMVGRDLRREAVPAPPPRGIPEDPLQGVRRHETSTPRAELGSAGLQQGIAHRVLPRAQAAVELPGAEAGDGALENAKHIPSGRPPR